MEYSRDEVIKALDHCIHLNGVSALDNFDECFDCPCRTVGEDTCVSLVPLLEAAMKLLKAQGTGESAEHSNVVKAIEMCSVCSRPSLYMVECPDIKALGFNNLGCMSSWFAVQKAALELLKAQETSYKDCGETFLPDGEIGRLYICESCDFIGYNCKKGKPNYCPNCGRKVKWDE